MRLHNWLYDSVKTACLRKIWRTSYRSNCSPPIRLQDYLSFNISKTIYGIVWPPLFFSPGEWGLNPYPIFKRGLNRISIFRGDMLAKRGVTFFRGGCSFHIKNKLKSEIFHKKIYFLFGYGLACPKFSEITNRQYLWKGLSDFINFLHVIIYILCDVH